MAVHIRLARYGTKKNPLYRIVATDQRNPRDGRFIETLGTLNPHVDGAALKVDQDRLNYWRNKGARPSHTLERLLKRKSQAPVETSS